MEFVIIVWIASIVAGVCVANSKGRSPWIGALWPFLFSFFGLVIVLCLRKSPDRIAEETLDAEEAMERAKARRRTQDGAPSPVHEKRWDSVDRR